MDKVCVLLLGSGFTGDASLESLLREKRIELVGVVTPPFEVGRYRLRLEELPLERRARDAGIHVRRTNVNHEIADFIRTSQPSAVVISTYNKILPVEILEMGPRFYNIHHGDLPRWRGSSSSEWAVITGRNEITLTLHEMVSELDGGDIWWQHTVSITDAETIVDLRRKMCEALRAYLGTVFSYMFHPERPCTLSAEVYRRKQEGTPTYTCSIREEDSMIDWSHPTKSIYDLVRGLCDPDLAPAYTFYGGEKLRVWSAEVLENPRIFEGRIPGKPVAILPGKGVEVLTGDGSVILKDVEYRGLPQNASQVITSIRNTLGVNLALLLEENKQLSDLCNLLKKAP